MASGVAAGLVLVLSVSVSISGCAALRSDRGPDDPSGSPVHSWSPVAQAPGDASAPTASTDGGAVPVPTESAPADSVPSQSAPVEPEPSESVPSESVPTESAPAESVPTGALTADDEDTLRRYAIDTWESMDAMVVPETGLVADHVDSTLAGPAPYTSPTNIGGYLWSVVVARDLGIVSSEDAAARMRTTLATLSAMERHGPSGMFYNWYSPTSAAKLTVWPDDDEAITPFLSTVDNGWLAAALRVVAAAEPAVAEEAASLSASMDFSWFLDEGAAGGAGLNRVGFWVQRPSSSCAEAAGDVFVTCASYDTAASEARIATYVGITNGQIPDSAYVAPSRTGPVASAGSGWMRKTAATTREYAGVRVLESTYAYDGMSVVPSWGGSMFEELMPDLFVPEAEWGPRSWGLNHPAIVAAQQRHAAPGAGVWGVSPAADPAGGYGEFGIDGVSIRSALVAAGLSDQAAGASDPAQPGTPGRRVTASTSVVTPHASFLALPYDPRGAMDNLQRLAEEYGLYGPGGFADAVDIDSGLVADTHLSLDQSMILAAIGNAVGDGMLRRYFVDDAFEERLRPLVEQQVFGTTLG